ncbi:MAG: Hpt domain-containing protein [Deltaproteobacteria bacterium]|jgi:chemotaxis protein histidine kinase CheA|nr:Hpt domain-containing protein [Deltaproteobacteria bacterium]
MSNDILEEFIFDSREHLANAGAQLMALEKDPRSLTDLNALMGTLHTIKGNSGFVNLRSLYSLLHAAETLLQTVRERADLFCPPSVIEQLFQVLDTAEVIMGRLENGENDEVEWMPALNQALTEAEAALEASVPARPAQTDPVPAPPESAAGELDFFPAEDSPPALDSAAAGSSPAPAAAEPEAAVQPAIVQPAIVQPAIVQPEAASETSPLPAGPSDEAAGVPEEPAAGPAGDLSLTVTLTGGQLAREGTAFLTCRRSLLEGLQTSLTVDLTGLEQFSTQEMELLISFQKTLGPRLRLVLDRQKQPDFYRVLEVLELDSVFRIFPDQPSALAAS